MRNRQNAKAMLFIAKDMELNGCLQTILGNDYLFWEEFEATSETK